MGRGGGAHPSDDEAPPKPPSRLPTRAQLPPFLALAVPSACRAGLDQGLVLGLALFAASLGGPAAAAHNVLVELFACVGGAVVWATGDAVTVRVGRALGAGDVAAARLSAGVGLGFSLCVSGVALSVLTPLRGELGFLFSSDPVVLALTADTIPALAALVAVSSLLFCLLGVLLGQGRGRAAARGWLLGAAVILPAAWGLGVATGGGVPGLWWAWTAGYGAACVALAGAVATSDWEALADAAVARHAAPLLKEEIT